METRLHHHTRRLVALVLILLVGLVQLQLPAAHAETYATPVKLEATLNGAQVTPGPGDPTGFGKFRFVLNGPPVNSMWISGYWCNLSSKNEGTHIHVYDADGNRFAVRYVLMEGTGECKSTDTTWNTSAALVSQMIEHPERVEVDVHSVLHPNGAIAGRLQYPPPPPPVIDQ